MKKNLKKVCVLLLVLSFISSVLFAQETENETGTVSGRANILSKNGIGAFLYTPTTWNAGETEFLYGISYQRWIIPEFAFEFGGMVYTDFFDDLTYNVFLEGDWAFFSYVSNENYATRLFLWGLFAHLGGLDYDVNYWFNLRGSVGVGFEMVIAQHIAIPLKFGMSASFKGFGFAFGTSLKYLW